MKLEPRGKFVVVELVKPDTGKLILLDTKLNGKSNPGSMMVLKIIAVGEGLLVHNGTRVPLELSPGDEVLVTPDTQMITPNPAIYPECENQHIINSENIVAVISGRGEYVPLKIARRELVA